MTERKGKDKSRNKINKAKQHKESRKETKHWREKVENKQGATNKNTNWKKNMTDD